MERKAGKVPTAIVGHWKSRRQSDLPDVVQGDLEKGLDASANFQFSLFN